ncbi:hypothetical protein A5730_12750 [Mycobacterium sp. ACS4054]|uniref:DUF5995 family protein n=1 Tax=Mycobacterium sp. ACS4054 TaxID=1834119 RepID=UPI000800BB91|nr:DUF5995 family protein [Mycobacterium sp. ACS4054]OBF07192.1 hypothetical protein A5730_12750 [Mycobacterium sp. ACS4054]
MAAPTPSAPEFRPHWLDEPKTIDDVLRNIDRVIDWAKTAESHLGYFAVLYRRTTLAIRDAIGDNVFEDGARMADLDIAFARRYFNALNAYFYPERGRGPTLPWEVAFVGDHDDQAIILQHMMAGLNAHITFDLGLAVFAVAGDSMDRLAVDYNRVNKILCKQLPDVLKVIDTLSPEIRWTRWLVPGEIRALDRSLVKLRRGAWEFAYFLATHRSKVTEKMVHQEAWAAALGSFYLQPPGRVTPFPALVRLIGKHEIRDVPANLHALEDVSNSPHRPRKGYR